MNYEVEMKGWMQKVALWHDDVEMKRVDAKGWH